MNETTVVHVRDGYDVYIGRGSEWGNPFIIGVHGTRKQVIKKYKEWIPTQPIWHRLHELEGKRLGCHCKPNHDCHGDFLAETINARMNMRIFWGNIDTGLRWE